MVESEQESLKMLEDATHYGDWHYDRVGGEFTSKKFLALANKYGFKDIWAIPDPILKKCSFYVGFWCGKDDDSICIRESSLQEEVDLDPVLSPSGNTPMRAIENAKRKKRVSFLARR